MDGRAAELIRSLDLAEHPEGGYFREVFRSSIAVFSGQGRRSALTAIYFLLVADDHSRWHVVRSDEVWNYYEGDPLELLIVEPDDLTVRRTVLGPAAGAQAPVQVVPAAHWQAARSLGEYTLVGCSVGPGFDFADFKLLRDDPETLTRFRQTVPDVEALL
jgi:predicted cupin superfamily sugar epimerase